MLIVYALIMALGLYVVDMCFKKTRQIYMYIIYFMFMLFGFWFFSDKAQADEICIEDVCYEFTYEMTEDAIRDINEFNWFLSKRIYMGPRNGGIERKDYVSLIKFHKGEAERTLADAKARCWAFPQLTDRQNAQYCYAALGGLLLPGDPMSKLVAILVATLTLYGVDCTNEWHYINNKLYWSQYHYEMAEFYEEALRKS